MNIVRNALALLLAFSCIAVPSGAAFAFDRGQSVVEVSSSGWTTVETPIYFSSAEILTLTTSDEAYSTNAVSESGSLTFYAQQTGTYEVDRTGDDVWSRIDALSSSSLLRHITDRKCLKPSISSGGGLTTWSSFNPYRASAEDETHGTADEPVTALVHFVGQGDNAQGSLELSKDAANGLIGYTTGSEAAEAAEAGKSSQVDFAPSYLLVEDRDENTGTLIASAFFTPDANETPAGLSVAGAQAFNLVVDPNEDLLLDRLSTNSEYEDDDSLCAESVSCIIQAEQIDDLVMLANLDTMCAYATGEKTYTLDIATLSNEDIKAGEEVVLKYYLGAGDENACTGSISSFESNLESTYETYTVDKDGFVTFNLYGGGIYALGNEKAVESLPAVPVANAAGQGGNNGGSGTGSTQSGTTDAGSATQSESGTQSVGSVASTGTSGSALASPLAATSTTPTTGSVSPTSSTGGTTNNATGGTTPRSTSTGVAALDPTEDEETGISTAALSPADTSLNSARQDDEAADVEAAEPIGFPLSLFLNEDGTVNIPMVVLAVVLVAVIAGVITLLIRRRMLHTREAAAEAEAEETMSAAAITRPKGAGSVQDIPVASDESAGTALTGAGLAASAAMAQKTTSSSTSAPETLEEKIKRRAARRTGSKPQFVGDSATAGDILNQLMGAQA